MCAIGATAVASAASRPNRVEPVRMMFRLCRTRLALYLSAGLANRSAAIVTVGGVVGTPLSVSADDVRSRFAEQLKPIRYESHGRPHTAYAVSLLTVLQAAGVGTTLKMDPKVDPASKNFPLRLSVAVKGRDGYTATFALAELLPEIGDRTVWMAVDADDPPFSDPVAPVEVIASADAKPGRWLRAVASVTVVDPSK